MVGMAARRSPIDDDRHQAIAIALDGLIHSDELGDIAARLAPLQPRHNTFPAEVLVDVAADAIMFSGASRQRPIEFEGIRERHLPDGIAQTKAEHHKSMFALRAAAMLHGGVDPGLLDEVQWWRTDDLWYWSLEALAAYVRAAADLRRDTAIRLNSTRRSTQWTGSSTSAITSASRWALVPRSLLLSVGAVLGDRHHRRPCHPARCSAVVADFAVDEVHIENADIAVVLFRPIKHDEREKHREFLDCWRPTRWRGRPYAQ